MPQRTGIEVLRSIRTDPSLSGTKVILLTSKAQESDVEAGLIAGADFYLTNPIARASAVMAECSAVAQGFAREAAE
jgi:CheY-like chemotaxis protein